MSRFWIRRTLALLALVPAITFSYANKADAQTTWSNGATGFSWNNAGNWSSGLPSIITATNFTDAGAGAILLNGAAATLGMTFSNSVAYSFATGTGTNTLTIGSGGITMNGSANVSIANAVAVQAAQSWSNNTAGVLTVSGTVALGANILSFTGSGTGATTVSGVVSGTGGITNTTTGAGVTTLSASNTYTGITTVNSGILAVAVMANGGAASGIGQSTNAAANLVLNGGTLRYTGAAVTSDRLFTLGTAGGSIESTAAALTLSNVGTIVMAGTGDRTLTLTGANGGTIAGIIGNPSSGNTILSKSAAGTWILSGANTFAGGTTVLGGILQANNNNALGTGSVTLSTTVAGRVQLNGGVTVANNFILNAGVGVAGVGYIQQTGTGLGRVNGTITINGNPNAGGTFVGGTAAGNELVLGGAISGTVGFSQRDGRVIYIGGGTATGQFTATNTVIIGATNGLPTGLDVALGGSGTATMNLNGFNQSIQKLVLGVGANIGNVTLGGNTLSVNGDLTVAGTAAASSTISGTAAGKIDFGSALRAIDVTNVTSADALVVSGGTIFASTGGINKSSLGTLTTTNAVFSGALNFNAGTIATSTALAPGGGVLTTNTLNLAGGTTFRMAVGTGGDIINGGTVTAAGTTTFSLLQIGGTLANGTYPLLNYTGASPTTAPFALQAGHSIATLIDTGTAIAVQVTGSAGSISWNTATTGVWDIGTTQNWALTIGGTPTNYFQGDDLVFPDVGAGPISITGTTPASIMLPFRMAFTNTAAVPYTIAAGTTITGTNSLSVTGGGTVTLANANSFTGAVTISGNSTLEVNYTTGNLTAASGVSVAAGSTLKLTSANVDFTFNRNISGAGTVLIDTATGGTAGARAVTISGTNTGFTGTWRLTPTGGLSTGSPAGTFRTVNTTTTPTSLGSASIVVNYGGQLWVSNNTYANNITISGTGYAETAGSTPNAGSGLAYGGIGAIRIDSGAIFTGNITINGNTKVMSFNGTGTINGPIGVTAASDLFVVGGGTSGSTLLLGGTNNAAGANSLNNIWINSGSSGTAATQRLNVGTGGTTGTLGVGNVTLFGDVFNAAIGFDRSNGYTLAAGQTITSAGTATTTFIDIDTLGTGFNDNGNIITLGAATPAAGGTFRVGQARTNAIANLTGTLTTESIFVASATTGAVLNINAGATINANALFAGNAANMSGVVNQTGGTVNVVGQVRAGHFGTNTSTFNISGGTLTLTGASPTLTPSTAAGGSAGVVGDNNITGAATAAIIGGGIYVGIDGTGIFNQSGGTVTTNWIVLDNRGDTVAGANMPDGIDRYNLTGGTLNVRSTYGIIGRNPSHLVTLGGGTIRVDNTGTGTGTGSNITIPLDAFIATTPATTTTLNTNGAGNGFTFLRDVTGTGTLALTGGGNVNFSTAAVQSIAPVISSTGTAANIVKLGAGTTNLNGGMAGFTGNVTVTTGQLNVPNNLGAGNITVADGATLGGEPILVNTLTLGTTNGANLYINPATTGAITASSLVANGTLNNLFFATIPAGTGTIAAIKYTTTTGPLNFTVANAASFRTAPTVTNNVGASQIEVGFTAGASLIWTGATSTAWNINTAQNWNNTTSAINPDVFFNADSVTFPDGPTNVALALTGFIAPSSITVNAATTNYTFTSTAGNQLFGPTGITKTGAASLTLTGPNVYSGQTNIGGGTVIINGATSLGDGSPTNTIAINGGGRLSTTVALDLGATRSINVGTGGGSISLNNAAAQTVTVSGNLTGASPDVLSFHSAAAGGGTFVLTGNNAGYTGGITVDSASTGLTTLRIGTASAATGGGFITVNYPALGATGNANTLDLLGTSLPAGVTVNFTSFLNGAISLRTQINSNGTSAVNGPLTVSGNNIIQFTVPTGTLNLNGNITETTAGAFTGTFFVRGASTAFSVINGTINLPSAGTSFSKTDAGSWQINSTGNVFANAAVAVGILRMGAAGALPANVNLTLGQNDANTASLDLNGFSQTVGSLVSNPTAVGANTTGKTITSATAATFTVNQSATTIYASLFTGAVSLVKDGTGSLTLPATTSSFTGNVTVANGTLVAGGTGSNTAGSLGNSSIAGRTLTVAALGTLSFASNNILGNGVGNANLPATTVTGGTLTSTRYNVLGDLTLNGGTLTQASTDAGGYEGFQFRGNILIGGTALSTITTTNAKANHLGASTLITVGDVATGTDLLISAPLRDQSADFASAAGSFTKAGAGTMQLTLGSTYSGGTTINAGSLLATNSAGSATGTGQVAVNSGATLLGTGILAPTATNGVTVASGATLRVGVGAGNPGVLTISPAAGGSVTFTAGSTFAVDVQGTAPGNTATNHGQLVVTGGTLNLGNATLNAVFSGYTPSGSDAINIINFTGATLNGTFNGLPEGAVAYSNVLGSGINYQIYYGTFSAGSVTLSPVPEPASILVIVGAGLGLACLRRRRNEAVQA